MGKGELYYVHYTGPATVRDETIKEDAGKWLCDHGEFITIEDILETIRDSTKGTERMVVIQADCPGAAGIYHRLIKKLENGDLNLGTIINRIKLDLACDYNELPLSDSEGSRWTKSFIQKQDCDMMEIYEK